MSAALAEKKLYYFVKAAWPILEPGNPFVDSWHLGCVCEHLEALTNLEITKLLLNLPRRRGKSVLCSVCWFCWAWIKEPWEQWNYMSYGSDLAERDSKKCRDLIQSEWYQQNWGDRFKIRQDQNAATRFANDKQGYRMSTSVAGRTTGYGASYNVGDDLCNLQDAWSPTILRKACDVWTQGVHQSVNNPSRSRFLLVMQRLAEGDPAGHVIDNDLGYETLILPEEYEPCRVVFSRDEAKEKAVKHPIVMTKLQRERPTIKIGTQVIHVKDPRINEGDLLSPERFPREYVEGEKKLLGPYGIASQKQQRPSPVEGSIFKRNLFRYFREETRANRRVFVLQDLRPDGSTKDRVIQLADCKLFQCIDTAMEIGDRNDWTVCATMLLTPYADLLLYDVWRYRIEVTHQFAALKLLRTTSCAWDEASTRLIPIKKWPKELLFQAVEKKASGHGLIQQGRAHGMPFKELLADQHPMDRIGPIASEYAAGKVYHLQGASWLSSFEGELMDFPNSSHDDQVVACAYGGYLMQHDAILREGIRELFVSDTETVEAAEELAGRRYDENKVTLNVPGIGGFSVEFDD